MNHIACRQFVAFGDPRVPRRAAAQRPAFLQQLRARSTVNRAVNATSTKQALVGGIDDRMDGETGNVPLNKLDLISHHLNLPDRRLLLRNHLQISSVSTIRAESSREIIRGCQPRRSSRSLICSGIATAHRASNRITGRQRSISSAKVARADGASL